MKETIIKKKQDLERTGGHIKPEDVFPFIEPSTKPNRSPKHDFLGHSVNVSSPRYNVFANKGCDCVTCGVKGKYFLLERHKASGPKQPYHLNLYAIDFEGDEVLMTVDHIIPASHGGPRSFDNLQPMCKVCNEEKGNTV
jgi:5-methylcytosine-specific restriction endonuclease McrA